MAAAAAALGAAAPGPVLAAEPAGALASPVLLVVAGIAVGLAVAAVAAGVPLVRLRRDLNQFRTAFDSIPWPRQVVGADGRPRRSNSAFRIYFPELQDIRADRDVPALPDLLKRDVHDHRDAEEIDRLAGNAARGTGGHLELAVQPASGGGPLTGDTVWLDVRAQPMHDRPGAVLWLAEEITARRHMQEILQSEQARFVDLLEHAPVGFYSVDQAGRFLFANATLAEWLETTPERLTEGSVRLHDVAPQAAEAGAAAYVPFAEGLDAGGPETGHGETLLVGPHGARVEAYVTQEVVPGDAPHALTTRSVVRNLSRERRAREALERSERRFRRFFEQAPVGIALVDAGGRVQECNAAFGRLMRADPATIAGRPLSGLVRTADREGVARMLADADGAAAPEVHPAADAETVCTLYATPLDDAETRAGHVVHLIDSTEQKNLEEQFAQSQKMQAVGQLAGGIAHDFNNLLTAMIGFCDLLLLRHRPGDQSFADLMQIKQNANRAANLVRQLLAFSRQQTLRPTVLSVTDVLQELTHLLRRLIGENIQLDIAHGRDLHNVKVDPGQLEQVIINLAVNARDAMSERGGTLTIRTRNQQVTRPLKREGETVPAGDYVLVEVTDTGCGIPQDKLDRIFEPFFTTKAPGAGTGLGLSTVYGIVKQTGGFILVDSTSDAGTTFQIYLPRHREDREEAFQRSSDPAAAKDLTGMGTLLLVEDEEAVRTFSARALRKKGYTVLEANSGETALALLKEQGSRVDLLVTDVVMPNLDGPALVKRVRERLPALKVIFISGYTEDSFRQHLDQDADIHFLPKPFTLKQLASAVKDVLQEPVG